MTTAALQALAKGNTTKAVKCLRMELAPLQVDTIQLHKLANAVMCQDEEDLQKVMGWVGPENGSRQNLLNHLQVCTAIVKSMSSHNGSLADHYRQFGEYCTKLWLEHLRCAKYQSHLQ